MSVTTSLFIPPQDFWNPNRWAPLQREFRIYLDDREAQYCIVDEVDYHYFKDWRWHVNKPHVSRRGKKQYATRTPGRGGRYLGKLYLHVEIMKRTGVEPPSPLHTIVDHRDGNEFNCRRANLRWATPSQNRMNQFGSLPTDLLEIIQCSAATS